MVKAIIEDMAALIKMERAILTITADAGDDGTNDMINRFSNLRKRIPGCCVHSLMKINF